MQWDALDDKVRLAEAVLSDPDKIAELRENVTAKLAELEKMPSPTLLCKHSFEEQHVYSCEEEYDIVAVVCSRCGKEDTQIGPCNHNEADKAEMKAERNSEMYE